jgi:hypothetical protein
VRNSGVAAVAAAADAVVLLFHSRTEAVALPRSLAATKGEKAPGGDHAARLAELLEARSEVGDGRPLSVVVVVKDAGWDAQREVCEPTVWGPDTAVPTVDRDYTFEPIYDALRDALQQIISSRSASCRIRVDVTPVGPTADKLPASAAVLVAPEMWERDVMCSPKDGASESSWDPAVASAVYHALCRGFASELSLPRAFSMVRNPIDRSTAPRSAKECRAALSRAWRLGVDDDD